jgi:hypothetical protein
VERQAVIMSTQENTSGERMNVVGVIQIQEADWRDIKRDRRGIDRDRD